MCKDGFVKTGSNKRCCRFPKRTSERIILMKQAYKNKCLIRRRYIYDKYVKENALLMEIMRDAGINLAVRGSVKLFRQKYSPSAFEFR